MDRAAVVVADAEAQALECLVFTELVIAVDGQCLRAAKILAGILEQLTHIPARGVEHFRIVVEMPGRDAVAGVEVQRDGLRHALGAHRDEMRLELAALHREVRLQLEGIGDLPLAVQCVDEGIRFLLGGVAAVEAERKADGAGLDEIGALIQRDRRGRVRTERSPPVREGEMQVVEHLLAIALVEGLQGVFGSVVGRELQRDVGGRTLALRLEVAGEQRVAGQQVFVVRTGDVERRSRRRVEAAVGTGFPQLDGRHVGIARRVEGRAAAIVVEDALERSPVRIVGWRVPAVVACAAISQRRIGGVRERHQGAGGDALIAITRLTIADVEQRAEAAVVAVPGIRDQEAQVGVGGVALLLLDGARIE